MNAQKLNVRTLICHQHVSIGLRCLGSLLHYSSEPISLIIHDDGSLTEEDKFILTAGLPGATVLSREEADTRILPLLTSYPECLAYRRRNPFALKLIDMPLLASGDLAYCDSDVLFLKPFKGLFSWPDKNCSAIFMQDIQDAYSLRPWHVYPIGGMRLPQKLNTGLFLFRASEYDLEFVEWFLGSSNLKPVFKKRPHWIEQTCWAAIAWRIGCRLWDSRQITVANPKMEAVCDERVAVHFVAAYRSRINDFPEAANGRHKRDQASTISSIPARLSSPLRVIVQDVARRY